MEKNEQENIYRVEGFSCAGCAGTFEKNVKRIPGVTNAEVNFLASKITVKGTASINELEKAGAFENLKVRSLEDDAEEGNDQPSFTFIKKYQNVLIAMVFFIVGLINQWQFGEEHVYSFGAYLLSIVIGGYSLFKTGFNNLLRAQFDMKTLMTVAVIGAAIIGEWSEGAIVVILFAISEQLERFSMDKARQSIKALMNIAPRKARIRRDGEEFTLSVKDVVIGDCLIVKPGEKLAMDGKVTTGHSSINQSAITGESIPVEKNAGDIVYAGTLNTEGYLEIEVTKLVKDTTLQKIIHLVEESQAEKAPSQSFIDRFARYYTPVIMVIALLVAIIPPLLFGAGWEAWIYQGLAVLVVGCPCALVISTPVAIVTAIGNAAKQGVLIKGGVYLEEMGRLNAVAFDKTGTLTKGEPVVTEFINYSNFTDDQMLTIVAAIEAYSQHPLAGAILQNADNKSLDYKQLEITNFSSMMGKGIKATIDYSTYWIGNRHLFEEDLQLVFSEDFKTVLNSLQNKGNTIMLVGNENNILSLLAVADELREQSVRVLQSLKEIGIKHTVMLTGDDQRTGDAIGEKLGIDLVKAELLPDEKLSAIKEVNAQYGSVAMVGDGVNDAPALASSNVGIAMGSAGTDTALETADVALMGDELEKLPYTISLSRRALNIIKQNIALSLGLKAIALLLVIPGWLTLWIAILSDMGATLLVTLNSLRLLRIKK
ncbi:MULTISPECIES: heavy metal translocating P-type ATPase [Bacillaceae]|uniref:Cd(2+)-exporting ATPase n=1 Tax=Alkalicoccobacillus plakortidis TaxID=444060 RepID=A0A9D5DUI3_9BACI|nr:MULTISPECIES: heavy metal translocating P-type ATPase [Bacillaceae]KQL56981.1 cadmium transporter [Alkalicoccobacillus plakortidis]